MKSIYSDQYRNLLELLLEARKAAGVTQQELAAKLKRPQSFVSKVERGERRLDVIEFLQVARLIGADPYAILQEVDRPKANRSKR